MHDRFTRQGKPRSAGAREQLALLSGEIGLKNDLGQVPDLVVEFDFAVNEQCAEFAECDRLLPFINSNRQPRGHAS